MYSGGLNQIYDNKNIYSIDAAKCICANLSNADCKNSLLTKLKLWTYVIKKKIETELH